MEGFLRISLLIILGVILCLMLFESRTRRRSAKFTEQEPTISDAFFSKEVKDPASTSESKVVEKKSVASSNVIIKPAQPQKPAVANPAQSLLVMSILAKPNHFFASYDLLQALSAAGMQFGDMNIFHYYFPTPTGKVTLFSLASAVKPGEFNMDKIGDFSCPGLTLFMDLSSVPDPAQAFEIMFKTAEQLAEDLDGELRAGQRQIWNEEILKQFRQKAFEYNGVKLSS